MPSQTMTLTIPEYVFDQLAVQAQIAGQPIGVIASQMLSRAVLPPVEDELPQAIHAELQAMTFLSDDSLVQIASSTMNEDKVALYDVLLDRNQDGTLTAEGRKLLHDLRDEADALMLRKAHAYALLKSRGHQLPALEDLESLA